MPTAFLLADSRGRVTYANRAAQALLARGGALTIGPQGELQVHDREQHAELRRALAKTIRAAKTGSGARSACFPLTRQKEGRPLAVTISPSRLRATELDAEPVVVSVLVADPDSPAHPRSADLVRLYRLTRREADLAVRLALGRKLGAIAGEMGIGLEAARTHLARIMQKTDTHRQPELVRLLLIGCPLGGDEAPGSEIP